MIYEKYIDFMTKQLATKQSPEYRKTKQNLENK